MRLPTKQWISILAATLGVALAPAALATIPAIVLQVDATNASGTALPFVIHDTDLSYNSGTGVYSYTLGAPFALDAGDGAGIAAINSLTISLVDAPAKTPRIAVTWTTTAGDSLTTLKVRSGAISFAALPAALSAAKASGSFSTTDRDGNGADLSGLNPANGWGIYTSRYNGGVPGGTMFANLIAQVTAGAGGTLTANGNQPSVGFSPLGVAISDIAVQADYNLTSHDDMSGNVNFVVTPEPLAGLLLACAALSLRRR